ncbi:MAG: helicase-exonuclease AddAB subunit AddA [Planctomycetota bacterium]|nr:MAG: helicase-exonuclease AddAB subunit AddA [Planctomycetota bacterium]
MAGKKIEWTEQQRRAIEQRGSDVLVTASAGTGKTAVLSGRCVDIVSDKDICPDVWSILVLTFTDAAAEQMRRRIGEQLEAAVKGSGDRHLRYQLLLLGGADISTIHSFCKRLITEYFYKLGLDPTFRVIDADEQRLLKTEALEQTIEWAWEQGHLVQGLEQLFRRRDLRTNDGFLSKIIDVSDFLDGVVRRERWYERAMVLVEAVNPFATDLAQKQKEVVVERLQYIQSQLRHAEGLYEAEKAEGSWVSECEEKFVRPVERCIEFLEAGEWDKCAEEIRGFEKPRVNKPKDLGEAAGELVQRTVKKAVDGFDELRSLAIVNPGYLEIVGGAVSLQTRVLVELVRKFDEFYAETKRSINCLDFADLEHYALELLVGEESWEDELKPSATALALREKYKYIFVDEYQDINAVQQAILDMLSGGGNDLYVGDVKQSIYAFRGAKPEIFLEHLKPASVDPKRAPKGFRVDLNKNWRSAKGILDFVNEVFGRIMTAGFAKIDYDESARLRAADEEAERAGEAVVELHLIDEEESKKASGHYSGRQYQAAMAARRIRQMVGAETGKAEFEVFDKQAGGYRAVEYRDIVVLMRSPAKRVDDYVEVLRLAGVPVSCESATGYFETTEISDCLSLLKVLDNPQRDIELAAVLRSPFFKASDTELAKIKIHSRNQEARKNFYECVVGYCESGGEAELVGKLKKVLGQIERWRVIARRGDLGDLLWQIYRETGYLSFVSALPNGRARRANLLKLHERAIQFEGFASSRAGNLSLTRFVEFVEKLQESGRDWRDASPEAEAENAVRIISVHKSKGLEFPVVFLAELNGEFSKKDFQEDCLVEADGLLGLRIIDRESNRKFDSMAYQLIEREKKEADLAEEMRILYVATTRARERLILSGCEKSGKLTEIICDCFSFGDGPIGDWQLRGCRSHLDWILYGLSRQRSLHEAFKTGLAERCEDGGLFSLDVYGKSEIGQLCKYVDKLKKGRSRRAAPKGKKAGAKGAESKLLCEVKESLGWRYGFGGASVLPAKLSVTELTHQEDEFVRLDYSKALERRPRAVLTGDLAGQIDGRLVGTATHLLISELDLGEAVTEEAIGQVKERLVTEGGISEAVAERIDAGSIKAFFECELGRMVLDGKNTVWREWPFTFSMSALEVRDSWFVTRGSREKLQCDDETVVVQGIIDMIIRTAEGLVVIDFKTDDISGKEVSSRAELYRGQLEVYGRAAGAILKSEMVSKYLYFLKPGRAIQV